MKELFLKRCVEKKILPKGFRLTFNLAQNLKNKTTLNKIRDILDTASSSILTAVLEETTAQKQQLADSVETIRRDETDMIGFQRVSSTFGKVKRNNRTVIRNIRQKHWKKLAKLTDEASQRSEPGLEIAQVPVHRGSQRISACTFTEKTSKPPGEKEGRKQAADPRRIRPHRTWNRGRKRSRKKKEYVPSEDDLKRFDPIILADGVTLTQDQISLTRMSDKFIPTPKTPIDVSDQIIGNHGWAERLRWHQFHAIREKEKAMEPLGIIPKENEEVFVKYPWYKCSEKSAPRGDAALESFIKKSCEDFVDITKRRKIKDNLTKEQRMAIGELRRLPLTHEAACRFADKSGVTVITSLSEDDRKIKDALNDAQQYDKLTSDPTQETMDTVNKWADKWGDVGQITEDVRGFVTNIDDTHPAKCKPLVKTHKTPPYPYRLLLSGNGTPIQPLSKFVQVATSHVTEHLPYQIIDTKEFLQKMDEVNEKVAPLPDTAILAVCDVVALYPSVDNNMGVPAMRRMLQKHPPPLETSTECVIEALEIALNNNSCAYTDKQGETVFATPNRGTAMGPCHAPDYVDVFMGELDEKLVESCPVPLVSSLVHADAVEETKTLNWNRFRDDGFAILLGESDVEEFQAHLQSLHTDGIKWTVSSGREVDYLDVKVSITDEGKIKTDVFSKNSNSYLPPSSCHPPSVFKGMTTGIGRRLRMICSEDKDLETRVEEYSKYLTMSGWPWQKAHDGIKSGTEKPREQILRGARSQKKKKIAWVTNYDPRVPSKSAIIKDNLHLLYANEDNMGFFPRGSIIGADRRGKNLGELYKPTIPHVHVFHGPKEQGGFFLCGGRCDTCSHSEEMHTFESPWDGRKWTIRQHLRCTTRNVVYVLICKCHPLLWYVGSTMNLKLRWANHKSDIKKKKVTKCKMSAHVSNTNHPPDPAVTFMKIFPVESVKDESDLLDREIYWQANLGTLVGGLNERKDFKSVLRHRVQYKV